MDEDVGDGVGDAGVDELVVVVSAHRRVGCDEGVESDDDVEDAAVVMAVPETFTDLVDVVVQEIRALDANSFDAVTVAFRNNTLKRKRVHTKQ